MPSQRVQRQIDRLLDEAEEALTQRDWTRVRDLAQDALALDPENEDAETFLAVPDATFTDVRVVVTREVREREGSG